MNKLILVWAVFGFLILSLMIVAQVMMIKSLTDYNKSVKNTTEERD